VVAVDALDLSAERDWFEHAVRDSQRVVRYAFEHATLLNVRKRTRTGACAVLHWSGHGHPYALPLEDGEGGTHWLRLEQLRSFLSCETAPPPPPPRRPPPPPPPPLPPPAPQLWPALPLALALALALVLGLALARCV
jgi:hypothetical protein